MCLRAHAHAQASCAASSRLGLLLGAMWVCTSRHAQRGARHSCRPRDFAQSAALRFSVCCVCQRDMTKLAEKKAPAEYLIDDFAKSFLGYTPYRFVRLRRNRALCANVAVRIRAPASPFPQRCAAYSSPECLLVPSATSWTSGGVITWEAMRPCQAEGGALPLCAACRSRGRSRAARAARGRGGRGERACSGGSIAVKKM